MRENLSIFSTKMAFRKVPSPNIWVLVDNYFILSILRKGRMRRVNLPKEITRWDGKKEIKLELQKALRVLTYNFELRNLLAQKLYEKHIH